METNPDPDGGTFVVTTKPYDFLVTTKYDSTDIVINQNSYDPSDWKCRLFGIDNFFFIPSKGNEPNWFWRAMQYILVGNKWSKK